MRTEQKARLIRDVGNPKLVSTTPISDRDIIGSRSKYGVK